MRLRGEHFFDDTVRLGRIFDLLQGERVRASFISDVVADAPARIETSIEDTIDWLVEQEHRRWQDVHDYLARRRNAGSSLLGTSGGSSDEQVVGGIGAGFDYNRRTVLRRVAQAADRTVSTYDREAEAEALSASLRGAVAQTAAAGAGAVGLGVGIAVIIGTAAADVTGIALGLALATVGLGILPLRRRRAKAQFAAQMQALRERLAATLREQFQKEMQTGEERLRDALAPYTRFVRVERERVAATTASLDQLGMELEALRREIESRS
jgi:hypothetical protein